jgi:hypothetical protein
MLMPHVFSECPNTERLVRRFRERRGYSTTTASEIKRAADADLAREYPELSELVTELRGVSALEGPLPEPLPMRKRNGYRAWIRTMNNASKGRTYKIVRRSTSTASGGLRSPRAGDAFILFLHFARLADCRRCGAFAAKSEEG